MGGPPPTMSNNDKDFKCEKKELHRHYPPHHNVFGVSWAAQDIQAEFWFVTLSCF